MKIKFEEINDRAMSLFEETRATLNASQQNNLRAKANSVPVKFIDENKKIRIVFAGQYSAGKSSILSILTSEKLQVGQGVTTSSCNYIDWNGWEVVDTPGIHTQKRPDHDAITYNAIAEADLIVFVVTAEGFSSHLGEHFRKLLIDKGKGHEMMLVVNKMNSTRMGNTSEQRNIFETDNLLPVISPEFSPQDLYVCYIDTDLYKESLEEQGEEKKELEEYSGYPELYKMLDKFVEDKNFLGKCTTSLYKLEQILSEVIAQFRTGDGIVDGSRQLLVQQRRMLNDTRARIKSRIHDVVRERTQQVRDWGVEVANDLSSSMTEEEFKASLQSKYDETDKISGQISKDIQNILCEENEKLVKSIEDLRNSEFVGDLEVAIKRKIEEMPVSEKTKHNVGKLAKRSKDAGTWLSKIATGPNAQGGWDAIFKLGSYSGSTVHKAVLWVGHAVGHKFAPWEAVKIAGKIGKIGKFLGVAGAVVGIVAQLWEDKQADNVEVQLRENRSEIRNSFNEAANVIDMHFDKKTQAWIEENIETKINDIDETIAEIESSENIADREYETYQHILDKTRKLISEVQHSQNITV